MVNSPRSRTVIFLSGVILFLVGTLVPSMALAASADVTIRFRPHCEAGSSCTNFPLYDEETAITNGLKEGDILDMDIVVSNPSRQPLQSVRSWLAYDPKILEGVDLRIVDAFPLVAPGEQTFSKESGIVKLGASNIAGGNTDIEIPFARVQWKVLKKAEELSFVRFYEFSLLGQEGKTEVLLVEGGRTMDVLKTRPKDLRLFFGDGAPPSILPGGSYSSSSGGNSSVPVIPGQTPGTIPTAGDSSFAQLQPQGLRIMTEGNRVFLLWTALQDPRVVGYNIYYGTVSGRYIQRRTVAAETTGITLRDLPLGKRYFFAITAVDQNGNDSEFSYEVAVIVGDPASSTAPFSLTSSGGGGGGSDLPGNVLDGISGGGGAAGTGMPLNALASITLFALLAGGAIILFRRRHFAS